MSTSFATIFRPVSAMLRTEESGNVRVFALTIRATEMNLSTRALCWGRWHTLLFRFPFFYFLVRSGHKSAMFSILGKFSTTGSSAIFTDRKVFQCAGSGRNVQKVSIV